MSNYTSIPVFKECCARLLAQPDQPTLKFGKKRWADFIKYVEVCSHITTTQDLVWTQEHAWGLHWEKYEGHPLKNLIEEWIERRSELLNEHELMLDRHIQEERERREAASPCISPDYARELRWVKTGRSR